jgi:hypothetical protein
MLPYLMIIFFFTTQDIDPWRDRVSVIKIPFFTMEKCEIAKEKIIDNLYSNTIQSIYCKRKNL